MVRARPAARLRRRRARCHVVPRRTRALPTVTRCACSTTCFHPLSPLKPGTAQLPRGGGLEPPCAGAAAPNAQVRALAGRTSRARVGRRPAASAAVAVDNDSDTPEASRLFEARAAGDARLHPRCAGGQARPLRHALPAHRSHPLRQPPVPPAARSTRSTATARPGARCAVYGAHPKAAAGRYVWPVEDLHALRRATSRPSPPSTWPAFAAALQPPPS